MKFLKEIQIFKKMWTTRIGDEISMTRAVLYSEE